MDGVARLTKKLKIGRGPTSQSDVVVKTGGLLPLLHLLVPAPIFVVDLQESNVVTTTSDTGGMYPTTDLEKDPLTQNVPTLFPAVAAIIGVFVPNFEFCYPFGGTEV